MTRACPPRAPCLSLSLALAALPLVAALGVERAAAQGASRGPLPEHAPRQVLVRLREGAGEDAVARALGTTAASVKRAVPARLAIEGFERRFGYPRNGRGGVTLRGRSYASLDVVPEGELFRVAYEALPTAGKRLYRTWVVSLPADQDVTAAARTLVASGEIEHAEPNLLLLTSLVPNDSRYGEQWSHQATDAEPGWDLETGDPGVVLAIVDTGVDVAHPDLAANVWHSPTGDPGRDFVDIQTGDYRDAGFELLPEEDYRVEDADPEDVHGHGTHVAGIAAAVGENATGVAGVCQRCSIMPARSGFAIELGGQVYGVLENDDSARAITWAAENGADVINMSFGSSVRSQVLEDAIAYARSLGSIPVAAAGNANTDWPFFPAAFTPVIAVAATAIDDDRSFYSNYGDWVDVAAPGGDTNKDTAILSTVPPSAALGDPSGYRTLQGTSMASPYVTGLVGLLLARFPTLDAAQVEVVLRSTSDAAASQKLIGQGRVNVARALAIGGPPTAEIQISSPKARQGLFQTPLAVVGTATGSSYSLEIAADPYASTWTPLGSGTTVVDGVLGSLDPTSLAPDRTHYLRLTVRDTFDLVLLVSVYAGWRHSIAGRIGSATVADVDGDGVDEILLRDHGEQYFDGRGKLYVWRGDGSLLPGFPVFADATSHPRLITPAVGDLDDDGTVEIVTTSIYGIEVLNHDGTRFADWPVHTSLTPPDSYTSETPTLADLDGNGDLELIAPAGYSGEEGSAGLWAWHHDRTPVAGFPVPIPRASGAAVGDLDQDGRPEIAVVQRGIHPEPYRLHVLHADGTPLPGWPLVPLDVGSQGSWSYQAWNPMFADLEGDGDLEVISAASGGGKPGAWHHDGTIVSGWPLAKGAHSPPILSDLDGDGDIEVIFLTNAAGYQAETWVTVFHHDGTEAEGWQQQVDGSPRGYTSFGAELVAGDIDGDGLREVIANVWDRVVAWHHDGTPVAGFPLSVPSLPSITAPLNPLWWAQSPALADLDGDGTVELVAPTYLSDVYVFELGGPYDDGPNAWPMEGRDPHHSDTLLTLCGNGVVDPGEACDDGGESPTCNGNCRPAACGDGVKNAAAGEDCDGLAGAAAGCCTAACRFEASGTTCDDGDVCTQTDGCALGVCAGSEEPADFCRGPVKPGKGSLSIVNASTDTADRLSWKWGAGQRTFRSEFGDPRATTAYALCLYDRSMTPGKVVFRKQIPPGGDCGGKPCWTKASVTTFRYSNRTPDDPLDIQKLQLTAGDEGNAKIKLSGKGGRLGPPGLPLTAPVSVRLHNLESGLCWGSDFDRFVTQNGPEKYRARSE